MASPEPKQQYEGAILNQLVKNAEKLAVIGSEFERAKPKIDKINILEQKIDKIYYVLSALKSMWVAIGIGVIINILANMYLNIFF